MFRMNFPRRFTSRPDFRLWPPPRNRPLNYRRQYARPVSCDPPSPPWPPCFFHAARFHLQDYYRSSQRQSANRETPDGVERLRVAPSQFGILITGQLTRHLVSLSFPLRGGRCCLLASFHHLIQFCNLILSVPGNGISGDINGIDQLPPKILQLEMV